MLKLLRRQRYLSIASCLVFVGCAPPPASSSSPVATQAAAPPATPTIPRPGGKLGLLDELFVQSYESRRRDVNVATTPVITVSGSQLFLYHNGVVASATVIPDRYHALKAVAHAPFTVYLTLRPVADRGPFPDAVSGRLATIASRLRGAIESLAGADLTAEQRTRAARILNLTSRFLDSAVVARQVDTKALNAHAREVGSLLLENAWDAGCSQIHETHRQVMAWRSEMSPGEWARLRVVIRGAHQARYKNAATQYFAWLLSDGTSSAPYPGESDRVVYAESIFGDQTARDVLATVTIDADASQAFFGEAQRMSEDVLRDGARDCIAQLDRR